MLIFIDKSKVESTSSVKHDKEGLRDMIVVKEGHDKKQIGLSLITINNYTL